MNKRNIATLIGVGGMLLVLIFYAAYAYIAPSTSLNNLNISADLGGQMLFTATGGNSFNLYVDEAAMEEGNANSVVASASDNVVITLETDGIDPMCCYYDIAWEWTETDVVANQYSLSAGATNEYVLSGSLSQTYLDANGNAQNVSGITNPLFSKQIPNYNATSLTNSVYSGKICNNTGALTTEAVQTYSLTANFYNVNVPQDQFRGVTLDGSAKVTNVSCSKPKPKLSDTVLALADGSERQSSQTDGGVYRVINPEVNVPSPTTYTKLTESEYGDVTEYQGTGTSTLPSAGTTLSEKMFDYNSSDNTYSNDVTNMATSSYYHMVVPIEENASYQICYKVTTAGERNYLYAYLTDETSSYNGYQMSSYQLSSVGTTYTCTDLGYLTEGQGIKIVNRTYTTIAAVTFYLQKSTEMTSNGNAGVRYQGKDPNNYVQFNGTELWRIIGVFEGSTIGLEEGKYYTKIIKNESIGNKYWNETNYVNNWVNASLNTYLTNTYLAGIDTNSSDMIAQDVTYYLGGAPVNNTYTLAQFYQAERGNTGGAAAPTVVTHQNEIGLMYPSDYGYAMYAGSSNNVCNTDMVIHKYSTQYLKCANYDWMFLQTNEWTISPTFGDSNRALYVTSGGYVYHNIVFDAESAVRPVLYLEASVGIESGEGTLGSPYILK